MELRFGLHLGVGFDFGSGYTVFKNATFIFSKEPNKCLRNNHPWDLPNIWSTWKQIYFQSSALTPWDSSLSASSLINRCRQHACGTLYLHRGNIHIRDLMSRKLRRWSMITMMVSVGAFMRYMSKVNRRRSIQWQRGVRGVQALSSWAFVWILVLVVLVIVVLLRLAFSPFCVFPFETSLDDNLPTRPAILQVGGCWPIPEWR